MAKTTKIKLEDKEYSLPIIVGTENEKGIDITRLRQESKYITFDPGFGNTGSCKSKITYIDGEKGILRYRGYPIEQLAEKSTFTEVSYLLLYGELPTRPQIEDFSQSLTRHSLIHESMLDFFRSYPSTGNPMAILSAMVSVLSGYYPELIKPFPTKKDIDTVAIELLAKVKTIAAFSYKKFLGEPLVYPIGRLKYVPNFLHMMFSSPTEAYMIDETVVRALEIIFILHADHEQNCSTSAVRLVGSSQANLFASISSGICALWGHLHGGANQGVIRMLEKIHENDGDYKKFIAKAKEKKSNIKLMGFGHRVYKNFDPRAKILKKMADAVLKKLGVQDPLLDIAINLEEVALKDSYFVERNLYPNVDFYSGIILRAIGIPTSMFTVIFAIGRMPGWIAHWKEMVESHDTKLGRPRQIYTGHTKRDYSPLSKRA